MKKRCSKSLYFNDLELAVISKNEFFEITLPYNCRYILLNLTLLNCFAMIKYCFRYARFLLEKKWLKPDTIKK